MKLLKILIVIFVTVSLLIGCSPQNEQIEETYSPEQSATGGVSEAAEYINVKDIDISLDGADTVITLSMLSGSRTTGYTESTLVKLPKYEITQLKQPQRLKIKLDNISFWDYEQKETWALSDFVLGLFREVPADNDSLIIYVQLSRNASYSVEEAEGDLIIRLTQGDENLNDAYYCVSNAFFEHQEGTWPDNIDMQPVLCSDLENKLLISQPFDTIQKAQAFMQDASESLNKALPDKSLFVIEVSRNNLPDYAIDANIFDEKYTVYKDDVLIETEVLLQNGKYLATASDGRIAFSRSYTPEEPAVEQYSYIESEKLWIRDTNGRLLNAEESEFFFKIDEAAFSADGKYICILDVSIENRVLYVYDFEAKELINLGEHGFGTQTAAFAWFDENTIYALSGSADNLQLRSCTILPDGEISITAVEEDAGSEGKIAVSYGRLFYADTSEGKIYEVTDERQEITDGHNFKISDDGSKMLVLKAISHEDELVLTDLNLYDIDSGETTNIAADTQVVDFHFMQNGAKVYYTEELEDDTDKKFALSSYDVTSGEVTEIARMRSGMFVPGLVPGTIYLIDSIDDTNNYATYIYDLSS